MTYSSRRKVHVLFSGMWAQLVWHPSVISWMKQMFFPSWTTINSKIKTLSFILLHLLSTFHIIRLSVEIADALIILIYHFNQNSKKFDAFKKFNFHVFLGCILCYKFLLYKCWRFRGGGYFLLYVFLSTAVIKPQQKYDAPHLQV